MVAGHSWPALLLPSADHDADLWVENFLLRFCSFDLSSPNLFLHRIPKYLSKGLIRVTRAVQPSARAPVLLNIILLLQEIITPHLESSWYNMPPLPEG